VESAELLVFFSSSRFTNHWHFCLKKRRSAACSFRYFYLYIYIVFFLYIYIYKYKVSVYRQKLCLVSCCLIVVVYSSRMFSRRLINQRVSLLYTRFLILFRPCVSIRNTTFWYAHKWKRRPKTGCRIETTEVIIP
jgi:hypothetical protein